MKVRALVIFVFVLAIGLSLATAYGADLSIRVLSVDGEPYTGGSIDPNADSVIIEIALSTWNFGSDVLFGIANKITLSDDTATPGQNLATVTDWNPANTGSTKVNSIFDTVLGGFWQVTAHEWYDAIAAQFSCVTASVPLWIWQVELQPTGITGTLSIKAETDADQTVPYDYSVLHAAPGCNAPFVDDVSGGDGELEITFESSGEDYLFERMWPLLKQPWYFKSPHAIAYDTEGNIYLADTGNNRVEKISPDGTLITRWGTTGTGTGQFNSPTGIAVSPESYVYVADFYNNRIQKFTSAGAFVITWGSAGSGDTNFTYPSGVAVDADGFVYVADSGNSYVKKFTPNGAFIKKWAMSVGGSPTNSLVAGRDGNIYLCETSGTVKKFTTEGGLITSWGGLSLPMGITTAPEGTVFVSDTGNDRIQKFTSTGGYLGQWGSTGTADGKFDSPRGIILTPDGYIYVADGYNDRIQKFTSGGTFVGKWASVGQDDSQLKAPQGVAIGSNGNVFVSDLSPVLPIRKFYDDGAFIARWGHASTWAGIAVDSVNGYFYAADTDNRTITKYTANGTLKGTFAVPQPTLDAIPQDLATDSSGNVYVAVPNYHNIQKFDIHGTFLYKCGRNGGDGTSGSGNGEFSSPKGLAVDIDNNVYVADTGNNRIQMFNDNGTAIYFIRKWGSPGSGDGQFSAPEAVAAVKLAGQSIVCVADTGNNRIQKFAGDGTFVYKWGSKGIDPGQFNAPKGIAFNAQGDVYVADSNNNRIQMFARLADPKAIIVAGGGGLAGDTLWDDTQMAANFAYRALTYQGYAKDSIYYLTADTDLDLDINGMNDDVDGDATLANLEYAITSWADDLTPTDNLIIYMVDHGGEDNFVLSNGTTLGSTDLADWIDSYQASTGKYVTLIYDACRSGSFIPDLSGDDRIVITSAEADQSAHFISQGSLSFSMLFWDEVFNGKNIADAFTSAQGAISTATGSQQVPQLYDPGNIAGIVDAGSGTTFSIAAPGIVSVGATPSLLNSTATALLYATGVTDAEGVARVWALIRPPAYLQASQTWPVQALPIVELQPTATPGRFEGSFDGFHDPGTYSVAIYASDRQGNSSDPSQTSVIVQSPLRRRAVIVAASKNADPASLAIIEENGTHAYNALKFQGYDSTEDIFYMSAAAAEGVDMAPALQPLRNHIANITADSSTYDVAFYLIGADSYGRFPLNSSDNLTAEAFDSWLDQLQAAIPGKVVVICDAGHVGSFAAELTPASGDEQDRIVIASTGPGQKACFLEEGKLSFSRFFWNRVVCGATLWDAFVDAKRSIEFIAAMSDLKSVNPLLDDNGDGSYNGSAGKDGLVARTYRLGTGIGLAAVKPLVREVAADVEIAYPDTDALIWADDLFSMTAIEKVWAVIIPPGYKITSYSQPLTGLPTVDMSYNSGMSRYEGSYDDFINAGLYHVAIYAMDGDGAIATPGLMTVLQQGGPDSYEDDDTLQRARVIGIGSSGRPGTQHHTFHDQADEDWAMFYAMPRIYTIEAQNPGSNCDPILAVYTTSGALALTPVDLGGAGDDEYVNWTCPAEGYYYVRASHGSGSYGPDSYYDLSVSISTAPSDGTVVGQVTDYYRNRPIAGCAVKVHVAGSPSSLLNTGTTNTAGWSERIDVAPGKYGVIALATDYVPSAAVEITVTALQDVTVTFRLKATADVTDADTDGVPDIEDNCWGLSNPSQADSDHDCKGPLYTSNPQCGDSCETYTNDYDNDGIADAVDKCWGYANASQADSDSDGVGDICDNCWAQANPDQNDSNLSCPAPPYTADPRCGDACEIVNICKADISGPPPGNPDGKVDSWDLLKIKQEFGRTGCTSSTCKADISGPPPGNPDGKVDSWDLLKIKQEFGRSNCLD